MAQEMKVQVEDAERRRLEDLNRSRRERGLIRAVHDLEGRSLLDQGRRGERGRPSWGGRSMGDPGRPLNPERLDIDYDRIAQVVRSALAESRKPEPLRVDLKEICRRFCISRSTVYRYMEQGDIPFEKVRGKLLFEPASVDQALKRLRRNAIGD